MEKLVRHLVWLLFLLSILPRSTYGRFNVEKSSISVISPDYLKSKEDSAIANFGIPHYGGTLLGTVIYPEKDSTGCEPFKNESLDSSSAKRAFFLLDRGECFFSKKVWNAQNAGAAAVLIADNKDEPLITMDNPSERSVSVDFLDKINIPSALIKKSFGENLKKCLKKGDRLMVKLDWTESVPHPDRRVEYELWTNSNDECGLRCDEQMKFIKDFKGHAQILEKGGFTKFTPHYITWFCPQPFIHTLQCKSQCINQGRYCAPDPEGDFWSGYQGKDVLLENLRQLCVHRVANESNRPWTWWDFATDVHIRCSMKQNKYSKDCAEKVIESLGISLEKVKKCMGDPDADADNPVLQAEQTLQVGHGSRGDVTILPTLVINNVQYRGNLDRIGVLEAICSGFKESTEPPICLTGDIETNECEEKNGGCWQDVKNNITSCKDTFRGRVCECPVAKGVQYHGDGYLSCEAIGPARCTVNHGGCWSETREGRTYSACTETQLKGCQCPSGFSGDGNTCQDVDECKEKLACQCQGCSCKNTWGGYDCKCNSNQLYIRDQDACIVRKASKVGMFLIILILCCVFGACIAGYLFYKYRLRSYMDSEIMSIMSQYMPIDNQRNEVQSLREDSA